MKTYKKCKLIRKGKLAGLVTRNFQNLRELERIDVWDHLGIKRFLF